MDQKELEYLRRIEDHAAQTGWVAPLTQEDKAYFAYLRQVCKRYNTIPCKQGHYKASNHRVHF